MGFNCAHCVKVLQQYFSTFYMQQLVMHVKFGDDTSGKMKLSPAPSFVENCHCRIASPKPLLGIIK